MLISLLIDGAKRSDKNFYVVTPNRAQKLYFVDLFNLDSSNYLIVAQHVALVIQELSVYLVRVNRIVTNNRSNLVRVLNLNELKETVQFCFGENY
jgi:hypothetical protein